MITRDDVLIALSNSGESAELLTIVPIIKRQGAKLISMTGNASRRWPSSRRAPGRRRCAGSVPAQSGADRQYHRRPGTGRRAGGGPARFARFWPEDFARSHPGGSLGRRLLTHVRDVMRVGGHSDSLAATSLPDAILEMSRGGIGMTAVVSPERRVIGVVTDGDLRRAFARNLDLRTLSVKRHHGARAALDRPDRLAVEAVEMMEQHKINQLPVVDEWAFWSAHSICTTSSRPRSSDARRFRTRRRQGARAPDQTDGF
jgi:arabinose-5-phosphate isomerase